MTAPASRHTKYSCVVLGEQQDVANRDEAGACGLGEAKEPRRAVEHCVATGGRRQLGVFKSAEACSRGLEDRGRAVGEDGGEDRKQWEEGDGRVPVVDA
eukprot:scaffold103804_cov40-Phaeocystis_antarctica.AAC.3